MCLVVFRRHYNAHSNDTAFTTWTTQLLRTRTAQLLRSRVNIQQDVNCVKHDLCMTAFLTSSADQSTLTWAPLCRSFLSCRSSFPPCGGQGTIYFWRETSSRIQAQRRCVQLGRMLEQVLNHTATLTQHSTPTQANKNTRNNTQNIPHNPIKTPRTTGMSILQVNINGITNKQEELR